MEKNDGWDPDKVFSKNFFRHCFNCIFVVCERLLLFDNRLLEWYDQNLTKMLDLNGEFPFLENSVPVAKAGLGLLSTHLQTLPLLIASAFGTKKHL